MSIIRVLTKNNEFTAFDELMMTELEEIVGDRAFYPWDTEFDSIQEMWNEDSTGSPTVVAIVKSLEEISQVVSFSQRHNLELSFRNGYYHVRNHSLTQDRIVIDLIGLTQVEINGKNYFFDREEDLRRNDLLLIH